MDVVSPTTEKATENSTEPNPKSKSPEMDEGMAATPSPTFSFAEASGPIEKTARMPLKDLADLGKIVEEKAEEWQVFQQQINTEDIFPQMFRKLKWHLKIPNSEKLPETITADILAEADAKLDDAFRGYAETILKIHDETCQQIRHAVESLINFGLASLAEDEATKMIDEIKVHIEVQATKRREEREARQISAADEESKRKETQQARNAECAARRSHIKTPPSPGIQLSKKQQETADRRVLLPTPVSKNRLVTPTRGFQSVPRPPHRPRKWISSAPGNNQYQRQISFDRPRSRSREFNNRSGYPQNGNSGNFHRGPRQTTLTQHFAPIPPHHEPHPFYGQQRRGSRFY